MMEQTSTNQYPFKGRRICIATPAYTGDVTTNHYLSSIRLPGEMIKHGVQVTFAPTAGDGLIQRARAALVNEFMLQQELPEEHRPTDLLFIDADIGYTPEDVLKLLAADKEIVCGVYRKRQEQLSFPMRLNQSFQDLSSGRDLIRIDETGCMDIKYAPGGFMLVSRAAIIKMIAAYPERRCMLDEGNWFTDTNKYGYNLFPCDPDSDGMLLSEDYGFCKLWTAIGGQVWMVPSINLVHTGRKSFSGCFGDLLKLKPEFTQVATQVVSA